jgi:hypothetical protein
MMTLADHAEAWWRESGKEVPPRETAAWREMYESWIGFAFPLPKKRRSS